MTIRTEKHEISSNCCEFEELRAYLDDIFFKSLIKYNRVFSKFIHVLKSDKSDEIKSKYEYQFRKSEVERRNYFSIKMIKLFSQLLQNNQNLREILNNLQNDKQIQTESLLDFASEIVAKVEEKLTRQGL
ncbi:MAG: hypothetical protein GF364_16365 [Candidatus Lokiarchaeota archaeon]|nr:hypothetical protein [Candidatus Lokiarchaeota archaeon]